jgi:hypothetical protein
VGRVLDSGPVYVHIHADRMFIFSMTPTALSVPSKAAVPTADVLCGRSAQHLRPAVILFLAAN